MTNVGITTSPAFEDSTVIALESIVGAVRCQGRITEFVIANGPIVTEYLAAFVTQAHSEVLLSTCFWARSPSLNIIHNALLTLNNRARRDGRRITVRILFSSYSFQQKFLSLRGTRIWAPSTWNKLGLPGKEELDSLDVTIFSRFRKPFGVMHAKFLVIDRKTVVLPRENWYELALRVEGDIVEQFITYFFRYYHPTGGDSPPLTIEDAIHSSSPFRTNHPNLSCDLISPPDLSIVFLSQGASRLAALPFSKVKSATALFRLDAIARARRSIFIQTPNLTSRCLIKALKSAVLNSIEVTLYLPRNMMVLESLVTGWTTTAWCVWRLRRWARKHPEGRLNVHWFQSDATQDFVIEENKSHIKFMVIDEELVIVGSSNLDRASVYTSGEVDIAFSDSGLAKALLLAVKGHQSTEQYERDTRV